MAIRGFNAFLHSSLGDRAENESHLKDELLEFEPKGW